MWIADKYIDHVKEETTAHPGKSWDQMLLGFKLNKLRTKLLPKKGISKGYQKLEAIDRVSFLLFQRVSSGRFLYRLRAEYGNRPDAVFLPQDICGSNRQRVGAGTAVCGDDLAVLRWEPEYVPVSGEEEGGALYFSGRSLQG